MQERALKNDKIQIHWHTSVIDVLGKDAVTGVRIINNQTQEESDMAAGARSWLLVTHQTQSSLYHTLIMMRMAI